MEAIEIHYRKILSAQTYRLEAVSFTKPDGKGGRHEQKNEVYFRRDAVAVLLVDREKEEFILGRQFWLPVFVNPQGEADGYLLEAVPDSLRLGNRPSRHTDLLRGRAYTRHTERILLVSALNLFLFARNLSF